MTNFKKIDGIAINLDLVRTISYKEEESKKYSEEDMTKAKLCDLLNSEEEKMEKDCKAWYEIRDALNLIREDRGKKEVCFKLILEYGHIAESESTAAYADTIESEIEYKTEQEAEARINEILINQNSDETEI